MRHSSASRPDSSSRRHASPPYQQLTKQHLTVKIAKKAQFELFAHTHAPRLRGGPRRPGKTFLRRATTSAGAAKVVARLKKVLPGLGHLAPEVALSYEQQSGKMGTTVKTA